MEFQELNDAIYAINKDYWLYMIADVDVADLPPAEEIEEDILDLAEGDFERSLKILQSSSELQNDPINDSKNLAAIKSLQNALSQTSMLASVSFYFSKIGSEGYSNGWPCSTKEISNSKSGIGSTILLE